MRKVAITASFIVASILGSGIAFAAPANRAYVSAVGCPGHSIQGSPIVSFPTRANAEQFYGNLIKQQGTDGGFKRISIGRTSDAKVFASTSFRCP